MYMNSINIFLMQIPKVFHKYVGDLETVVHTETHWPSLIGRARLGQHLEDLSVEALQM